MDLYNRTASLRSSNSAFTDLPMTSDFQRHGMASCHRKNFLPGYQTSRCFPNTLTFLDSSF